MLQHGLTPYPIMKKKLIIAAALVAATSLSSCDKISKMVGSDSSSTPKVNTVKGDNLDSVSETPEQTDAAKEATDKIVGIYRNAIKKLEKAKNEEEIDHIADGIRIDIASIPAGTAFNAAQRDAIKEAEGDYLDARQRRENKLKFGQEEPDESIPADEFMKRDY